nr:coproporphyrinogen-III oxidase 1, chloroplastic-like isoform X3 [Physcomitrium patens]|eukprot:XP_024358683.1 coproporphyrinogen-III oxidase 1, chloroplastic-like isoform X3 [Physcomitrella patens]
MRARFESMIRKAQDDICAAVEAVDGSKFREDTWIRPGGGGGISRVLQDGNVWEKAGVNVSVVYGSMPPEAYRAAIGGASANEEAKNKAGRIPFFAAGVSSVCSLLFECLTLCSARSCQFTTSLMHPYCLFQHCYSSHSSEFFGTRCIHVESIIKVRSYRTAVTSGWGFQVMHPKNPMAPTVHFNYRYFETDSPQDVEGAPRAWWFGGGTDLTPSYLFEEDVKHFHQVQKQACDKHDPEFYPKFKKWCDDYFLIKHRGERRGLGGIFFDDLNDRDPEKILTFSTECVNSVIPAYIPLVEKRKDMTFTEKQKAWQQLRRGRYVEFNLVYDRGTTFGLKTGGRIESILMSLPLTARWEYDHTPEEGSEEWKLLNACRSPVEWAALEL